MLMYASSDMLLSLWFRKIKTKTSHLIIYKYAKEIEIQLNISFILS
jgi:hypothetical protein